MKGLIVCCVVFLSLAFAQDAQAFIYNFGGEKISVVEELPDTEEWQTPTGYADACVIYEQFWILWIPLWNSNARYVLGRDGSDTFYEFPDATQKSEIISKHGEASSAIPFWDKIGGKLLVGLILIIWIVAKVGGTGGEDEEAFAEEDPS